MPIKFKTEGITVKQFEKICKEKVLLFSLIAFSIGYFVPKKPK